MTRPNPSDTDDQHDDDGIEITDEDAARLLDDPDDAESDDTDDGDKPERRSDKDRDAQAREIAKWKSLARKHERESRTRADKLRQYEDANKSESERLQEALAEVKARADKAEAAVRRREIAEDRAPAHATSAQIKAVAKRLSGDSDDDLEADADELFALLAPAPVKESREAPRTPSRPKERLRPGNSDPEDDDDETDPRKLADLIRRNR